MDGGKDNIKDAKEEQDVIKENIKNVKKKSVTSSDEGNLTKDDIEDAREEQDNIDNFENESIKSSDEDDLTKPGNRDYLSYYIYQGEPRPTRPLKSIGASFKGPGPAVVNLPTAIGEQDHDPRRIKAPAYKIGERDMRQYYSCAPGSNTYNTRTLTNKGKDECHAPKIGEKLKGLEPFSRPGPTNYHRGDSDNFAYPNPPAYSMRFAHDIRQPFKSPAPDKYTLPPCIGKGKWPYAGGPTHVIAERLKSLIPGKSPGPSAYKLPATNVTKQKPPAYSMGLKVEGVSRITSPGPGSNELHMVKFHKPAPPRYTFGIRHSPYEVFQAFAAAD
ncbi:outer dense fiber protein 3 [Nephila pilipes]|uniref:Outer dense fiber protein 3 n=1 Tax=Nephila pilipes TaxID=299642 RepID=A0A8X6MY65_NEPPI|nr:outer dense fiber protein 3 [Nephila pilipes]